MAKDLGNPSRSSDETTLNIRLIRNDNAPVFGSKLYTVAILQNFTVGQTVTSVQATDNDPVVCDSFDQFVSFELLG